MNPKKLTVITFNVQGVPSFSEKTRYRFKKITRALKKEDADIINLQEVFTYRNLNILKSCLKNYPYFGYSKFILGPRGGVVTFSKIPLKKEKYIPYSSVNLLKSKLLKTFRRNMLTGKGILVTRIDGLDSDELKKAPIFILNTHLIANSSNDWSKKNSFNCVYLDQIEKLTSAIRSLKNYAVLILSGDFNIPVGSDLYKTMVSNLKMTDVFAKETRPTFHKKFLPKGEMGNRLDYLLTKSNRIKLIVSSKTHIFTTRLISRNINRGFVSDHLGLKATLSFSKT